MLGRLRKARLHFLRSALFLPDIARVRNIPPCLFSNDTSRVPPPKSMTNTQNTSTLWRPQAIAAAVGSFITLKIDQESSSDFLPGALASVTKTVGFLATSSTLPSALFLQERREGCHPHSQPSSALRVKTTVTSKNRPGTMASRQLKGQSECRKGGVDTQRGGRLSA